MNQINLESSRWEILEDALTKLTSKILDKIKLSLWSECHPELYRQMEKNIRSLHQTMIKKARIVIQDNLDELLKDLKLKEKLDLLDKLEREQEQYQDDGQAWRPSGNPELDMLPADLQSLSTYKDRLAQLLAEREAQVAELKSRVRDNRQQIHHMEQRIRDTLERVETASERPCRATKTIASSP